MLHYAKRIYQLKSIKQQSNDGKTRVKATKKSCNQETKISGMSSATDVKCLQQIADVNVHSADCFKDVLGLCDSGRSHLWISGHFAKNPKCRVFRRNSELGGLITSNWPTL